MVTRITAISCASSLLSLISIPFVNSYAAPIGRHDTPDRLQLKVPLLGNATQQLSVKDRTNVPGGMTGKV
jgi:hypothetical protein